jgi:hypothetical protein
VGTGRAEEGAIEKREGHRVDEVEDRWFEAQERRTERLGKCHCHVADCQWEATANANVSVNVNVNVNVNGSENAIATAAGTATANARGPSAGYIYRID